SATLLSHRSSAASSHFNDKPHCSKPSSRPFPVPRRTTSSPLQFTSRGHVLGFSSDGVYVAGGSHALRVEFVNARPTNPASDTVTGDGTPSDAQRAAPLSRVTYPNLWDGVTLTYDATSGEIVRSAYR